MSKKSPARVLKDKGLIPREWDLRKPLTSGQKSWITKQSKTYAQLIKRPRDFTIRTVSKANAAALKDSGYRVDGKRAILPTKGQKIRIKNGQIEIIKPGQTERVLLKGGKDFLKRLSKLDSEKPLPPGQYYALKVGQTTTVTGSSKKTIGELMRYGANIKWNSPDGADNVSLVIIKVTDAPGSIASREIDPDQDNDYDDDDEGDEYA